MMADKTNSLSFRISSAAYFIDSPISDIALRTISLSALISSDENSKLDALFSIAFSTNILSFLISS